MKKDTKTNNMKIEKLKTLKTLLGTNEIVLTGSTALAYHGLLTLDEAKDLDLLLINASPTTIEVLSRLQKENPSPKHKQGSPVNYSFIYEGVKVDVWVTAETFTDLLVTDYGVKVASISSIVSAKLSYNRPKDYIQLMKLASKIFDADKFKTQLHSINTDSDAEYDEEVA